jgi:hypothetical protein
MYKVYFPVRIPKHQQDQSLVHCMPSYTTQLSLKLPLSRNNHGGEMNDHFLSRTPSHKRSARRDPRIKPFTSEPVSIFFARLRTNRASGRNNHENPVGQL